MNYKYLYPLFINGIILGIYLLFSYQFSYAQTPTPTSQPQQVPTTTITLPSPTPLPPPTPVSTNNTVTSAPQAAARGQFQVLTLTLAELGYEDVTITGPLGEAEFNLHLPSYWEIGSGSSLTLHYMPEKGLGDSVETFELQVIFDGEIIYRTVLDTLEEQSLNIPLPEIQLEPKEGHSLKVLLRSQGEDCQSNFFGLLRIFSDSFFSLNYRVTPPLLDLAYYPSPIYERTFFTQTAYVVLPDQPAQLPVEAGLSLSARLGQLTENNLILTTTTASALDPANLPDEHLIVIGTPESNSLLSYLNDSLLLPASFKERRLELAYVGPDLIIPDTLLTHTLYITNNEAVSATNLGLNVQLPPLTQRVSCQPGCQRTENMIHWDIGALQAGRSSTMTLSFSSPPTTTLEPVNFSFELVQNQEIINVLTPHTPVAFEGQPGLTQTTTASPFFFVLQGRTVPETDGIIQLLPSPQQFDKAILLVTGLTDEAVYKAGRALGSQPELLGMKGQVMLVQSISQDNDAQVEMPQNLTFTDLGYEDRLVVGTTSQDTLYRFGLPLNWRLTSEAEVRLNFAHSSLLDPANSSITLIFNNTPIASALLDESNIMTGELRALLPPERARLGRLNNLVVRVEMGARDPCMNAASTQIWTILKATSSLFLPHTLNEGPEQFDLDLLPVPFATNPSLGDVVFALPEHPSSVEYDTTIKVASYLGSGSLSSYFQPAALLGAPGKVDLSDTHLIIVGRPSRNLLLQEVNGSLPQPFIPGTDTILPQVDRVVFRLPDNIDLGYLQLIPSNWNQKQALLALTGTSDLGLSWATQMIVEQEKNEQLKGNLALAANDLEVHSTDTRELPSGGKIAAVATAIPETVIVGTATPTPLPPTPTPVPITIASPPTPNLPALPKWFPYTIGGGIALIFIILGIAYWQARRRVRLRI